MRLRRPEELRLRSPCGSASGLLIASTNTCDGMTWVAGGWPTRIRRVVVDRVLRGEHEHLHHQPEPQPEKQHVHGRNSRFIRKPPRQVAVRTVDWGGSAPSRR